MVKLDPGIALFLSVNKQQPIIAFGLPYTNEHIHVMSQFTTPILFSCVTQR